jgi:hypothetical protein
LQVHASVVPGARPPVGEFFLGRVFLWVGLVGACALPLVILTWREFSPSERLGEALGVLVWMVVMVIMGERLRWPSRDDRRTLRGAVQMVMWHRWTSREADRLSAMLSAGTLATAIVHVALAIVAGPLGLFLWFGPTVWIGSLLPLISDIESDFGNAFTWTLMCGAQSAIVAWLCGRAINRARRALRTQFR